MKATKFMTLIAAVSFSVGAFAADQLKNVRATKRVAENVISQIEQGKEEAAFTQLKVYWPLAPGEIDDMLAHTKEQRKIVKERFGQPLSVEFIRTEEVGNSLVRHTFIEKFERHALRWQLSFYKPSDHWIVNTIYWDDKVSEVYST
ncbi:MAG: hypothetical protein AB7I18_00225 [Candidatus Berkiella sp.]